MTAPAGAATEHVLAALDPEQRAVAETLQGPVCVLAGAGTGKTRAITHRIAHAVLSGAVPAGQILAVTFTARAAGEMRARLHDLGLTAASAGQVQARTFHAAALRQLTYFHPRVIGGPLPPLIDSKARLVQQAAQRSRIPTDRLLLRDLTAEIEWAKAMLLTPEQYPTAAAQHGRRPPVDAVDVARAATAYEEVKTENGVCDFEDVLLLTAAAIETSPEVAAEVRTRYRWFVVDEYQDVNPLQQRLLDCWLGDRHDLCVVGDASQTIYSFTGASPSYLLDFRRRFPDARVVRLIRDYRSTPQVVALANQLLATSPQRLELVAQQPAGPEPVFTGYADEAAEAAGVARECRALLDRGVTASEIAVLFRTNAQSPSYEQALADAGIGYVVRGGVRFFDRPEVREAMRLLRGAARSSDAAGPMALSATVRHVLAAAGWTDAAPAGSGAVRERWDGLAAIVRLAEDASAADTGLDVAGFASLLQDRALAQHPPTVQGVTLGSLHAAKGLEWDAVFIVGLVDGVVPIALATTQAQIDEERRLLYVGITRAHRHLHLSWAYARSTGARGARMPSRFLDGLSAAVAGLPPTRGRGRRRSTTRCRVCGKSLVEPLEIKLSRCSGCPSDLDEALFDRLRSWRKERANAAGKPAFTVFTDATLTAIAEQRPSSREALLTIPGVGPAKFRDYGEDVLALCAS